MYRLCLMNPLLISLMDSTPPSERPRERCLTQGARCLSLRECMALILGSGPRGVGCMGVASSILSRAGEGLPEDEQERAFFTALETSGGAHLQGIAGLGEANQARVLAAFELGRRYANYREKNRQLEPRPKGRSSSLPEEAFDRIEASWRSEPKEWLAFVPVYRTGRLGDFCLVEHGVRTHVNVDPVELFARLLALRPSGFYLFHNHPSGDLTPSPSDVDLTMKVKQMAAHFGIRLLGHGIVTTLGERWVLV